jgi:cytochrome c oxidase subunit II
MKKTMLLLGVIAFALIFSGCSLGKPAVTVENDASEKSGMSEVKEDIQIQPDSSEISEESMVDESGMVKEVKVPLVAENFSFGTSEIKVKKGSKLVVSVTNKEGFHDLLIDELKINTGMIPEGETMEVEIPTTTAGSFEYYCSVGSHRSMGMKGMLIIEE